MRQTEKFDPMQNIENETGKNANNDHEKVLGWESLLRVAICG